MEKLTVTNVAPDVKEAIENIAKNQGIPVSSFLKPELRKIVESYPKEMRERKRNSD